MKQPINTLLNYLNCDDSAVKTRYLNLLSSFWHKDEGVLFGTPSINNKNDVRLTWTLPNGKKETHTIKQFELPSTMPISFIKDLVDTLANKVEIQQGKGLSTQDFTTELLNKLKNLNNYVHPEFHQISEIEGLSEALSNKVNAETDKQLSTNDFTNSEKSKLNDLPIKEQSAFSFTDRVKAFAFEGNGNGVTNVNALLLNGVHDSQFLRSDQDDTLVGRIVTGASTTLRDKGIYGHYNSRKVGHIWSMGDFFSVAEDGSDFGNLYGFAYKHQNNVSGGLLASGHQGVWCQNGTPYVAMGTNLWVRNSVNAARGLFNNSNNSLFTAEIINGGGHGRGLRILAGNTSNHSIPFLVSRHNGTHLFDIRGDGTTTLSGVLTANGYKSSDGSEGITQTVNLSNNDTLEIKNGIITKYTQGLRPS